VCCASQAANFNSLPLPEKKYLRLETRINPALFFFELVASRELPPMSHTLFSARPTLIGSWTVGTKTPITALAAGPGPNQVAVATGHIAKVMEYVQTGGSAMLMCFGAEMKAAERVTGVSVGSDMLACSVVRPAHNSKAVDALTLELGPGARVDTYVNPATDDHSDGESSPVRLKCRPRALRRHGDWVTGIAEQRVADSIMLNDDERLPLATSSHDNSVVLWNMQSSNKDRSIGCLIAAEPGGLTCVNWAFESADDDTASIVVAGSVNGSLYVWPDALKLAYGDDNKTAKGLHICDAEITCVAAHPCEPMVVVGARDGTVALVTIVGDQAKVHHRIVGDGAIKSLSWNMEGTMFVAARNLLQRRSLAKTAGVSFAAASEMHVSDSTSALEFYDANLQLLHRHVKSGPAITSAAWMRKYSSRQVFAGTDNGNVALLAF
jgi:hypothetical protein